MNYYLDKHSEAIDRNNRQFNEESKLPDTTNYIPGDIIILKNGGRYKLNIDRKWELYN